MPPQPAPESGGSRSWELMRPPDRDEGDVAFVVPDSTGALDEAKLLTHCPSELARYKPAQGRARR
ncbi:hypothetical protein Ga0074812_12559 [Parafrankia irregularis]|uniref:Uncharacterized protein n=1 Tax=Parafrankia irregularis TaxID=795642 RepID=A0A0S4QUA1_9ACTN|nr:hypothetical protein Ga0074812_12559 [Parafrankia irregularis]